MTTDLRKEYDEKGYVIVRKAIDADLAGETAAHVHWLAERNPGVRPERFMHDMLVTDPFMHRLVSDARLVDIVEQFLGPNIAMWAAHYIAKPPKHGQKVLWHQDGCLWPLDPVEVTTIWLAATESTRENGCLRVLPRTQDIHLLSRHERVDAQDGNNVLGVTVHPSLIDDSDVVDLELERRAMSPCTIRASSTGRTPTTSDKWRIGLTLRYIPTSTRVMREGDRPILVRGAPDARNNNNLRGSAGLRPGNPHAFPRLRKNG